MSVVRRFLPAGLVILMLVQGGRSLSADDKSDAKTNANKTEANKADAKGTSRWS